LIGHFGGRGCGSVDTHHGSVHRHNLGPVDVEHLGNHVVSDTLHRSRRERLAKGGWQVAQVHQNPVALRRPLMR
jgi:hypothetical protein